MGTWADGVQACTPNALAYALAVTATEPTCSTCGVSPQSGKLSCCYTGGDWFQQCGRYGDANFAHTWSDGIKACKHATQEAQAQTHAQAQAQAQPQAETHAQSQP